MKPQKQYDIYISSLEHKYSNKFPVAILDLCFVYFGFLQIKTSLIFGEVKRLNTFHTK